LVALQLWVWHVGFTDICDYVTITKYHMRAYICIMHNLGTWSIAPEENILPLNRDDKLHDFNLNLVT